MGTRPPQARLSQPSRLTDEPLKPVLRRLPRLNIRHYLSLYRICRSRTTFNKAHAFWAATGRPRLTPSHNPPSTSIPRYAERTRKKATPCPVMETQRRTPPRRGTTHTAPWSLVDDSIGADDEAEEAITPSQFQAASGAPALQSDMACIGAEGCASCKHLQFCSVVSLPVVLIKTCSS